MPLASCILFKSINFTTLFVTVIFIQSHISVFVLSSYTNHFSRWYFVALPMFIVSWASSRKRPSIPAYKHNSCKWHGQLRSRKPCPDGIHLRELPLWYASDTVEPRFNEPLYKEVLGITNAIRKPKRETYPM